MGETRSETGQELLSVLVYLFQEDPPSDEEFCGEGSGLKTNREVGVKEEVRLLVVDVGVPGAGVG